MIKLIQNLRTFSKVATNVNNTINYAIFHTHPLKFPFLSCTYFPNSSSPHKRFLINRPVFFPNIPRYTGPLFALYFVDTESPDGPKRLVIILPIRPGPGTIFRSRPCSNSTQQHSAGTILHPSRNCRVR